MPENRTAVFYLGSRVLLRRALATGPVTTCAGAPAAAELVVVDACSLDQEELQARLRELDPALPRVILSPRGAESAPAGSFAAVQAGAEALALAGAADAVVLRCALLGQDLALACAHASTEGTFYSSCEPAGAPWLDAADLAELITVLAADPARRGGRAYEITGPAVLGVDEAIASLSGVDGAPRRHVHLPEEAYLHAMRRAGADSVLGERTGHYLAWGSAPERRSVSPVLARALGRRPRPLPDYLPEALRAHPAFTAAPRG